jgi:hypothetical protein
MYELLIFFWLGGLFSLLFVLAEILHIWLHIPAEATRKVVHIGSGLLALLFPVYFNVSSGCYLKMGGFLSKVE